MTKVNTIEWKEEALVLLDCTKLPVKEEYIVCKDYNTVGKAIKVLAVRGAPAIGIAAAYGVVLAAQEAMEKGLKKEEFLDYINVGIEYLRGTRPTAVNLFWALNRIKAVLKNNSSKSEGDIKDILLKEAHSIYEEDVTCNKKIGEFGAEIVNKGDSILTHCNAGALATAAFGTALSVVRSAHYSGKDIHVFVDETRPLLQGARLTAWEMVKENIPATLITDNMAGYAMKLGRVDLVITGADRITLNGDTANKIGTYSVAVLAKEHGIPFYIAAPLSTIDINLKEGAEIEIEERDKDEVRHIFGTRTAPQEIDTFNPAFDVTPNNLIAGIITEVGILRPPYEQSIKKAFGIK